MRLVILEDLISAKCKLTKGIIADDTLARDPQLRQLRVRERLSADLGDPIRNRDAVGFPLMSGENAVLVGQSPDGLGCAMSDTTLTLVVVPVISEGRRTDRRKRNRSGQR